jgi:IclR family KDG regulon transcriptional repressor
MRYEIRSISRALELLELFIEEPELSLTEISQQLDVSLSTTFRLVATLQAHDYLERSSENRKYRLGVACLELGGTFLRQNDLRTQALPILRDLRADTMETVHLARLVGSEVVYLEKLSGLLPITVRASWIGRRVPAHSTSLGKAMLSYKPESEIRQLYAECGLRRLTPNTITDLEELLGELTRTRERGYAIDDQENEPNVICIGVPIFDYQQSVVGAISLSGPAERINQAIAEKGLVSRVKEAAHAISRLMGYGKL